MSALEVEFCLARKSIKPEHHSHLYMSCSKRFLCGSSNPNARSLPLSDICRATKLGKAECFNDIPVHVTSAVHLLWNALSSGTCPEQQLASALEKIEAANQYQVQDFGVRYRDFTKKSVRTILDFCQKSIDEQPEQVFTDNKQPPPCAPLCELWNDRCNVCLQYYLWQWVLPSGLHSVLVDWHRVVAQQLYAL